MTWQSWGSSCWGCVESFVFEKGLWATWPTCGFSCRACHQGCVPPLHLLSWRAQLAVDGHKSECCVPCLLINANTAARIVECKSFRHNKSGHHPPTQLGPLPRGMGPCVQFVALQRGFRFSPRGGSLCVRRRVYEVSLPGWQRSAPSAPLRRGNKVAKRCVFPCIL